MPPIILDFFHEVGPPTPQDIVSRLAESGSIATPRGIGPERQNRLGDMSLLLIAAIAFAFLDHGRLSTHSFIGRSRAPRGEARDRDRPKSGLGDRSRRPHLEGQAPRLFFVPGARQDQNRYVGRWVPLKRGGYGIVG